MLRKQVGLILDFAVFYLLKQKQLFTGMQNESVSKYVYLKDLAKYVGL